MNRNKSIRVAILCLSLAMAGSLPIDAQKVTFHEGSISLKQAFEKLESSSAYKIAYNDSQLDVSRKVSMDQKVGSIAGLITAVKEYGIHV